MTEKPLLIRLDLGNDATENLGILIEDSSWFVVKRNRRNVESLEEWLFNVKEWCKDICKPREGKKVYIGSTWKEVSYKDTKGNNCSITMRIVYEVTERTIDKNGQILFGLISVGER